MNDMDQAAEQPQQELEPVLDYDWMERARSASSFTLWALGRDPHGDRLTGGAR